MVKRYDQHDRHEPIEEMANGDYVRHEDYAALAERCEGLEADARRYNTIIGLCTAFIHKGVIGRDTLLRSDSKETWDSTIDLISERHGVKK